MADLREVRFLIIDLRQHGGLASPRFSNLHMPLAVASFHEEATEEAFDRRFLVTVQSIVVSFAPHAIEASDFDVADVLGPIRACLFGDSLLKVRDQALRKPSVDIPFYVLVRGVVVAV